MPHSATIWFPPASLCLDFDLKGGKTCASTCPSVNPWHSPSPLCVCWRTRALENTRYTSVTPAPKSTHGPALISSSYIVSLFKLHRKFMLVTLVRRASGKNIPVSAHENQSVLSSSRNYTKQTKLSLDGLDCMPRKVCSRCLRNRQRGGREESPRGRQMILERTRPKGNVVKPGHWTASNVHKRHVKELPLLQTPSNQAPSLKFQVMAVYFFFYKKLDSERQIFLCSPRPSHSYNCGHFMPGWLQQSSFFLKKT